MKRTSKLLFLILLMIVVVPVTAQDGSILDAIIERGVLRCGVNEGLLGFGSQNDAGEWVGFDVDICKAVAIAIFNDPTAVEYVPTSAQERQFKLAFGEIDMLSRNTTFTFSRDTEWDARFGPVTFYDGQGLMVMRESGIINLDILAGGTICVETNTTTEANIRDILESRGEDGARPDAPSLPYRVIDPSGEVIQEDPPTSVPTTTLITFASADEMMDAFFGGRCDAVTTDKSGLAARRAASENPEEIQILPLTLSKEPLAPLSPDSDPAFANIIMWTVFGLFQAEAHDVNMTNIEDYAANPPENADIQRLLGLGGATAGDYLGIDNDFMVNVIRELGNYGEIYERHLGLNTPLGLDRELNEIWTNDGLLYAPPFR